MQKIAMLALAGILTFGISTGVSAEEEEPAKVTYGGVEELADLKNHTKEIKQLRYQLFGEGGLVQYDATENAEDVVLFLSEMEIQEETDLDACDCDEYFNVVFEDGSEMVFWFNGKNFRQKDADRKTGYITYVVKDFEAFHIEKYGTEMMEHQITVVSDQDSIVVEIPETAYAGDVIRIQTCYVADGEVKIEIDGGDAGEFVEEAVYEFSMPDNDITIKAWISTEGYAGS